MSHKSPFRSSTRPASSSPAASTSTGGGGGVGLSSYKHLHSTLADADSSSDDDIDPRWTHPKVRAAESAKGQREGAPRSAASTHAANFTRTGYVPTASPVETSYLNTSGVTGTTRLDASQVQRAWERGIGTTEGLRNNNATSAIAEEGASDLSASEAGGGRGTDPHTGFYSGIPAPNVNLAGMTEEQRELVEYLQARVGQCGQPYAFEMFPEPAIHHCGDDPLCWNRCSHFSPLLGPAAFVRCVRLCFCPCIVVVAAQMRSSVSAWISCSVLTR